MKKEDLIKLKKQIESLSEDEKKQRDIYLKNLSNGTYQGPMTGYSSVDKPWLKYYSEEAIKTDLPKMSCYDLLLQTATRMPKNTALNYLNKKISYGELIKNIDIVANSLNKMGLKKGNVICVSLPNIPESAYLMYACSKLGIIANMIDPRTSTEGVKEYAFESKSKYLFMIDAYIDKVEKLKEDNIFDKIISVSPLESLPSLKSVYNIKNINKKQKNEIYGWKKFIDEGKNNIAKSIEYEEGLPLLIEHTGGTTGTPKGVILSNDSVNAVVYGSKFTNNNFKEGNNWLNIMPTFIAYGAAIGMHFPLVSGMINILIPQFDPNKFGELLKKYKPNYMAGVPSHWESIIENKKLKGKDLSFLEMPAVGGDALNIELEKKLNEFLSLHSCDAKISKGYGMTEVCGGAVSTGRENNKIGSVGSPFCYNTVGIFDPETGEELYYNNPGEICFYSPSVMNGYLNNEKETNNIIKIHDDGKKWVHSGDIGYIDNDGNIFIIDRIKRIIIRYDGFKVFPSLIENVINTNDNVVSSKVIGVKDSNHSHGFLPKAYVVLNNDDKESLKNIEDLCKKELPEYMQPAFFEVCDELPLTSIGKIDYKSLEKENELILKRR